MGCFSCAGSRTQSPVRDYTISSSHEIQVPRNKKQEFLLRIPSCSVHLMEDRQAVELYNGEAPWNKARGSLGRLDSFLNEHFCFSAAAPSSASRNNNINWTKVRKVSKMTERISKSLLDGMQFATGSVMGPVVKSQAGKAFLSMVTGGVLLASLDALNSVLDAAEAAEKQVFTAASKAASRMVSQLFGEDAGEATEDVPATDGH
ncbi:hypothetical protein MLD38_015037 [Melastoma candidum]|uniref:Uncharacterized protein n=1 Tax=Melastoma candidum TaxID=119954 RepID=A0ACB9RHU3_9MYRT|nr:hypothetical protein MLD38_015037 [Melastoma candidum]